MAGLTTTFTQSFTFRDAKGQQSRMLFYINTAGSSANPFVVNANNLAAAVYAALAGSTTSGGQGGPNSMTNAFLQSASGPVSIVTQTNYGLGLGSAAGYQEVVDKAELVFSTAAGTIHRWEVPAPVAALFEADTQTINPQAGAGTPPHLVVAFVAAILTAQDGSFISTRDGVALNEFKGGFWRGRKLPKRVNINVRTPALTSQLPAQ